MILVINKGEACYYLAKNEKHVSKSFLAIPKSSNLDKLANYISKFSNCEVTTPSNREDVLVVVMENIDQSAEDKTLLKLHESQSLEHMVLVSSFNDDDN